MRCQRLPLRLPPPPANTWALSFAQPDYNPVLGHPMEHKTKPKSSAARLEERKSVLMR